MVVLLITASLEGQHLAKSFFNTGLLGAAGGGVELPSDDQFNRVSFLSHFDGANNGVNNVFDDGSANNYTVTAAGNVTQGSFGPFAKPDGEWGVSFDSSDVAPISAADSADWDFASGNFTVEAFVFPTKLGTYQPIIVHWGDFSGSNIAWSLNLSNNDKWSFLFKIGSTIYEAGVGDAVVAAGLNQWYHLAAVRNGNDFTVYVNGTAYGTVITNAGTINNCTDVLRIGAYHATYTWTGNISNARIVKGTAVYTGNFTAPTSKLTAVTNTKLLTCQSNRFVDNSASAHTLTSSGKTAISAFGPFLTSNVYDAAVNGASAYMDGSGDTLRATWTAANIINQNFTLEYWLYYTQTSGYGSVSIGANDNSASYTSLTYLASNGQVFSDDGQNSGSGPDVGAGAISPNSWNHLALVRVSNDMFIYINGVKKVTKAITASLFQGQSGEFGIGYIANPLEGYICDARIVTSAVYTGNTYTVPTAPLTAITNTKLLLNMADGQAIDSAAQNNLTLVGTAKTSTAQKKFGTASLLLDGNSDGAILNGDSFNAGTAGDFTIELFARFVAQQDYMALVTNWANGNNDWYWGYYAANDELRFYPGPKSFSFSASNDTWYHIALVRTGGSLKCFVDGTQVGSTQSDATDVHHSPYILLGKHGNGEYFNGYMDEIRLSNFARYTSNFTAPSAAFADKGQ